MEALTKVASRKAHLLIDKPGHKGIILRTLKESNNSLSSYGISKQCELSYYQVEKRMSELEREELIEQVCLVKDSDGANRTAYRLV